MTPENLPKHLRRENKMHRSWDDDGYWEVDDAVDAEWDLKLNVNFAIIERQRD